MEDKEVSPEINENSLVEDPVTEDGETEPVEPVAPEAATQPEEKEEKQESAEAVVPADEAEDDEPDGEEDQRSFIERDAADFMSEFPQKDLRDLMEDHLFLRFCGSRLGREPIAGLYRDYLEIVDQTQHVAYAQHSGSSRKPVDPSQKESDPRITPAQKKLLEQWNTAYPYMKMTAEEFLHRENQLDEGEKN